MEKKHDFTSLRTPFLTQYASKRTRCAEIQGHYCPRQAMWMINIDGTEIPLIDHARGAIELVTKTDSHHEADDNDCTSTFTEMATKTETNVEQDDESSFCWLEIATKTHAWHESDDESQNVKTMFL